MRYILKTFLIVCILSNLGCAQTPDYNSKMMGFESEVDSLMKVYHTVGVSVAIIKDGKTFYARGFGYKDLENKIPADEHTVYGIGSCTKAFTAALFGIFEKEGRLNFEDKPSKYIPELLFYNPQMDEDIRIKHILSHSTGMPSLSTESSAVFFRSNDKNVIIPRLKYLKPQSNIGEQWIYNNYMYALAGRLTEHVTNNSWQENLSKYIFKPLNMNSTYGNVVPASKDLHFSLGYGVLDSVAIKVLPENFPTRDAGGNIYSNVTDVSKWLTMWINNGRHKNKQFLSQDYIKKATGKQQLINTDTITNQSQYYGYGWMNSIQEGHLTIEHSGGVSGYTSNIVFFPEDNLGIIVLSNQNTSGISFAITDKIKTRLLNVDIQPNPNEPYFSTMVTIEDPKTDTVINSEKPPTHKLNDFEGDFYHPGFGTITISYIENTLYAKIPFTTFRLEHQHDNVFHDLFTVRKSQVVGNFLNFNFQSDMDGKINSMLLNVDNEPVVFLKK